MFKYPNTDRNTGCSKTVADMVDAGYSKKEIRNHFGIYSKETKEGQAIDRMIDRYKKAKRLGRSIIIYEDVKDSVVDMIDPNNSLSNIERDSIRNRIEIVDDERMPYLEDGTPIDILLNMSGSIRR